MNNHTIKVRIFNSEYNLQGDSLQEVERVAGYLDNLMHKISYDSPNQPIETIAVVSALNIAENYFKEKDKRKFTDKDQVEFIERQLAKLGDVHRLLDEVL